LISASIINLKKIAVDRIKKGIAKKKMKKHFLRMNFDQFI